MDKTGQEVSIFLNNPKVLKVYIKIYQLVQESLIANKLNEELKNEMQREAKNEFELKPMLIHLSMTWMTEYKQWHGNNFVLLAVCFILKTRWTGLTRPGQSWMICRNSLILYCFNWYFRLQSITPLAWTFLFNLFLLKHQIFINQFVETSLHLTRFNSTYNTEI